MLCLYRRVGLCLHQYRRPSSMPAAEAIAASYCHAPIVALTIRPVNNPSDNARDRTMTRVRYITNRFVDIVASSGRAWPLSKLKATVMDKTTLLSY